MTRARSWLVLAAVLAAAFAAVAQEQEAPRTRRRPARGPGRDSLLGLLRLEQVQKELKVNEEQLAKIKKVSEELTAEMKKQFADLRKIEDRDKRRAKMTELSAQLDQKAEEQLRGALAQEQMTRLRQIRMQVRPAVVTLGTKPVADELKLTEEQKKSLAEISKDMQTKRSELFRSMREATPEQRKEAFGKYRKLQSDADNKALEVLTAEQKKAFEKMKGKKFELEARRGQRQGT